LYEAKALARRGLVFLVAFEGERTLADNHLGIVLLRAPIPGTSVDKTSLFCTQLRFAAFGHLQHIMPYCLDVKRHIECRKSVRVSTVMLYETKDDYFVSIKRSSGATDSGSRADSGRNEVVLQHVQRQ
jgi:hypothetical protein